MVVNFENRVVVMAGSKTTPSLIAQMVINRIQFYLERKGLEIHK